MNKVKRYFYLNLCFFSFLICSHSLYALTNGGVVTGSIDEVGEVDSYTFSATAGESVLLQISRTDDTTFDINVFAPDGSPFGGNTTGAFLNTLTQTGSYTVDVKAVASQGIGSYNLYYVKAPGANEHGSLINGSSRVETITDGDIDSYTFDADAGESIILSMEGSINTRYYIFRPDGSALTTNGQSGGGNATQAFSSLADSGTYTVFVVSQTAHQAGNYELHYVKAPGANEHGLLSNGGKHSGYIDGADLDSFTFSASAGETVGWSLSKDGSTAFEVRIYEPDGSWLTGTQSDYFWQNLTQTGIYTAVVDSVTATASGNYDLHFVKIPGANEHGLIENGNSYSGTITSGDYDSYTFDGVAGQRIELSATGGIAYQLMLFRPDNTLRASGQNSLTIPSLAQSGVHTLIVRSSTNYATGNYQLSFDASGTSLKIADGTDGSIPEKEEFSSEPKSCQANKLVGNPVNIGQAFKGQIETDYRSGALTFERIYRSDSDWTNSTLGMYWHHNYFRKLHFYLDVSGDKHVEVVDGRGAIVGFEEVGSVWQLTDPDYKAKFENVLTASVLEGYKYTTTSDTQEFYDLAGLLTRIAYRTGETLDFTYDISNRLVAVTGEGGYALAFTYDVNDRIATMTSPSGIHTYTYSGNNLVSVLKPDVQTRIYHYEDVGFPNALTGITDEKGNRYTTWAYDAQGRAILSEHAGGVDNYTITYNLDDTVTTTNPLGKQTTYHFSTIQGVREIVQVEGHVSTNCAAANKNYTYDADGFLASKTNWQSNVTQYIRDSRGLVTTMTEAVGSPDQRITTYTYDSVYRLPDVITEPGRTIDYDYDADGRLTALTVTDTATTDSRTTAYSYFPSTIDGNGNTVLGKLQQVDGSRTGVSDVTAYLYDAQYNLTKITNALGQETDFTAFDSAGRVLSMTDRNGVASSFTYDAMGRLLTQTVSARTTTYQYDQAGLLAQLSLADGREYTYSYDDAQRLVGMQSVTGESIEYILDVTGNVTEKIIRDSDNVVTNRYRQEFDELSRVMASVETINATEARTEFDYDTNNNLTTVTDPYLDLSQYTYDDLQRQTDFTDAKSGVTGTAYNVLDQLTNVTAPNNAQTVFTYNAFDEVTQEVSPDRGTTNYTYDSAGNFLTRTDARGITATFVYDALSRLTSVSYPDTSENILYVYDDNPGGEITCTFGEGRLCRIEDESGVTHYAYDEYGNIVDRAHTELGISYSHSFTYDDGDQLTQMTTSGNRLIKIIRDSERRISEVMAQVNGVLSSIVSNLQYRPDGTETNVDFGNGVSEDRTYDENGLLQAETTGIAPPAENIPFPLWSIVGLGAVLSMLGAIARGRARKFVFSLLVPLFFVGTLMPDVVQADENLTYDLKKNILSKQTSAGTTTYQYDELNRITNEQGASATQGFIYDANHNRLTDGGGANTYTTNSNQLATHYGNAIVYDAAGNITDNGQGLTFEYNQSGRLKRVYDSAVLVVTYTYNSFGQRTRKVTLTDTTVYHYDLNGNLIEETLADGTPQNTYLWRNNKPSAIIYKSGTPSNATAQETTVYLHSDHLNTPRSATDENKTTVWIWESDAFGATAENVDPDSNGNNVFVNLRFPGQYLDSESGLYYNWNRYYDPAIGRYITSDRIGLGGGSNTYTYTLSNPLAYVDKNGLLSTGVFTRLFYPKSAEFIENLMIKSKKEYEAYKKYAQATKDAVDSVFKQGGGPVVSAASLGSFGEFTPNVKSNELRISRKILQDVEDGVVGAKEFLEVVVKHEVAHYLDDQDGWDYTGDPNNKGDGEEGNEFERYVYGRIATSYQDAAFLLKKSCN